MAFVAIGGTRTLTPRRRAYERLRARGAEMPAITHRTAVVAASAQVLDGAVVGPDATAGEDAMVNAGVVVGHDAVVGPHCHVASGRDSREAW